MLLSTSSRLNSTIFSRVILAVLLISALTTGCASFGTRGEIPFGTWSGEGVVVSERWKQDDDDSESESISRRYPTTLTIQPIVLEGHDVIEMEIHSYHSDMPSTDDVHIKAALVKAKRVSDSTVLYRLVDLKFNPTPENELDFKEDGPPYAASCTSNDGTTVFQIVYRKDFVDAFRFRGRRLEKMGAYFDPKEHLVHWYEDLIKQD